MNLIKTIAAAFSMFSIIPMPQFDFDDQNNKYMLAIFPVVGAVQGLLLWGVYALCVRYTRYYVLLSFKSYIDFFDNFFFFFS